MQEINDFLNDLYSKRDMYSRGKIIELIKEKINEPKCSKCNLLGKDGPCDECYLKR